MWVLPGNIDPEISKISNCYLFDLNDLEQFFTLFLMKIIKIFFNEGKKSFIEDESLSFFKKLGFNENQKEIFNLMLKSFFLKIVKRTIEKFFKIFKSFK